MKFPFGWNVGKLFFGVDVLNLDFGVQVDSIEQPIKRNSVGPGNMSHCGTPPFMIILITASLSSKIYNKASLREECTFEENPHFSDHQSFQEFSFALEM